MRLTIFGASGGTGRLAVADALERGHTVTVFGRSKERLPEVGASGRQVVGDVRDEGAGRDAVRGADAVLVLLGAAPSDRSGLRGHGTATILRAMRAEGVERVVCMSCLGVDDSYAEQDWFTRKVVLDLWLWRVVADHAVQEMLVRESGLRWTIVRPPHLTPKDDGAVQVFASDVRSPRSHVGRGDLARYFLDLVERDEQEGAVIGVCAA